MPWRFTLANVSDKVIEGPEQSRGRPGALTSSRESVRRGSHSALGTNWRAKAGINIAQNTILTPRGEGVDGMDKRRNNRNWASELHGKDAILLSKARRAETCFLHI